MIKTGVVISIMNRKAGIMTASGEFVYIKTNKVLPNIGEIYSGELSKKTLPFYKYAITAASIMFVLVSSTFAYAYYTPVTTIVLSINPSVSLEANRWNKIINSKALNSDGLLLLDNIKLKNKSIDDGLELLIQEAKTEQFINDKYVSDKKVISVDIKSNSDSSIDISNFKNLIDANNLATIINTSSNNNKNIDIIVNNKKIDTSNINPNNKEKQLINNDSNIKINPPKNPSVNSSAKEKEIKPSENKEKVKTNIKTTNIENSKIKKDASIEKEKTKDNNTSSIIKAPESIKESKTIKKSEPIKKSDEPYEGELNKTTNTIKEVEPSKKNDAIREDEPIKKNDSSKEDQVIKKNDDSSKNDDNSNKNKK